MVRAGEKLAELCRANGLRIKVRYLDLWVSDFIMPYDDLVIEMFAYYRNLTIPVISGRPFLDGRGEDKLMAQLLEKLREISCQ
jgi:hypothetical protein